MFNSMTKEMRERLSGKKIENLYLIGVDGNAFALMATFRKHATRDPNWKEEEILAVQDEALSGDYEHLVSTLIEYSEH